MPQSQSLSALSPTTVTTVDDGGGPSLSPRSPLGGGGDGDGRGPREHCHQRKVQTLLPPFEGVAARIDRILQRCGDRVKQGSVLFDARGQAHAASVAAAEAAKRKELGHGDAT